MRVFRRATAIVRASLDNGPPPGVCRITAMLPRSMKEQILHVGTSHSDTLRLAKSDTKFSELDMCLTCTWYLLTVDKNEVTLGLAENSPRHSLSIACTHG